MSNESLRYFEAFPTWLRSLADDALALAGVLSAESTPEAARRALAGGLTYLFQSLDLVPDGIEDIGFLDDAFILRLAAKQTIAVDGAHTADAKDALGKLADDVALVESFLREDFARLETYAKGLGKGAARGRTVDDVVADPAVRKALVSEVHGFAQAYSAPSFARDDKTLVKLRAFLAAKLPSAT